MKIKEERENKKKTHQYQTTNYLTTSALGGATEIISILF